MIEWAALVALAAFGVGVLLCAWRLWRGPDLVDRAMALDTLMGAVSAAAALGMLPCAEAKSLPAVPAREPNTRVGKVRFSALLSKSFITDGFSIVTLEPTMTGARLMAAQVSPSLVFRRR